MKKMFSYAAAAVLSLSLVSTAQANINTGVKAAKRAQQTKVVKPGYGKLTAAEATAVVSKTAAGRAVVATVKGLVAKGLMTDSASTSVLRGTARGVVVVGEAKACLTGMAGKGIAKAKSQLAYSRFAGLSAVGADVLAKAGTVFSAASSSVKSEVAGSQKSYLEKEMGVENATSKLNAITGSCALAAAN